MANAPRSGRGDRRFESSHSDFAGEAGSSLLERQEKPTHKNLGGLVVEGRGMLNSHVNA